METLNKNLVLLDEKVRVLISKYNTIVNEHLILKEHVAALEAKILSLSTSLEQKKILFESQDDESQFALLLINDLVDDISQLFSLQQGVYFEPANVNLEAKMAMEKDF
jgi:hypothetical protein